VESGWGARMRGGKVFFPLSKIKGQEGGRNGARRSVGNKRRADEGGDEEEPKGWQ